MPEHAKHVFTRAQYLHILNDSLRRDPRWRPGMAFIFLPPGADAASATAVGCTGPDEALPIYAEIERVASSLIEVREEPDAEAAGEARMDGVDASAVNAIASAHDPWPARGGQAGEAEGNAEQSAE